MSTFYHQETNRVMTRREVAAEQSLIEALSTRIYDALGASFESATDSEDDVRDSDVVKAIRQEYPLVAEEAVVGYLEGRHDT